MLTCKEAVRLASEQLDHKLPFWRRVSLRMHVALCRHCSRYRRQITTLDQVVGHHYQSEETGADTERLSDEALERIKSSLRSSESRSDSGEVQ